MVKHHNLHEHKAGDTKRLNNYKVERLRCNRSDPYSRSPGPRSDVHGRVSNPGPPGPVIWDLFLQLPVGVAIGFPPCHLLGTPNTKHPNHLSRLGGRGTDNSVTIRCARGKKKISTGGIVIAVGLRDRSWLHWGDSMMKPAVFRRRGVCCPIASYRAHAGLKISVAMTWNGYIGDACASGVVFLVARFLTGPITVVKVLE